MKTVPNLKKKTEYETIFYIKQMQRTLSVREKALNPKFDYTCIYIFQYCCINMFCRNGTRSMLVCTFHIRCSVICKTSRIIAKILLAFLYLFALHDMKVFLFKTCIDLI